MRTNSRGDAHAKWYVYVQKKTPLFRGGVMNRRRNNTKYDQTNSMGSFFRCATFLCSPHSPFVYILTLLWEILVGWQEFLNTCNYFRGQIKFSDPTYFVPYLHHSFVSPRCYSAPRGWWPPASCFGALALLQMLITLHSDCPSVDEQIVAQAATSNGRLFLHLC